MLWQDKKLREEVTDSGANNICIRSLPGLVSISTCLSAVDRLCASAEWQPDFPTGIFSKKEKHSIDVLQVLPTSGTSVVSGRFSRCSRQELLDFAHQETFILGVRSMKRKGVSVIV